MAEWSNAADSKSVVPIGYRGFESLSLRHSLHEEPAIPVTLPERWRFALKDDLSGVAAFELPRRNAGLAALIVAGMFVLFAGVLAYAIRGLHPGSAKTVFDFAVMLFKLFWILGWSLGVFILGALTVLLCFYRQSLHIGGGRLLNVPRIGPLRVIVEYDLARITNLRLESEKDGVRLRFDYGDKSRTIGDLMPRYEAENIAGAIRRAMPALSTIAVAVPRDEPIAEQAPAAAEASAEPLSLASALALVAANAVPLVGVLLGGWRLDEIMVLFWAESAVIAFYSLVKMAIVSRWLALPAGIFFVAHFGAFMAMHFLFIYQMFVRGPGAAAPEPGAYEALARVFVPLWPALLALLLSHGVSFAINFIGRREYRSATLTGLMAAPYRRVVLMQLTLIFGGWLVMLLHNPVPALALLIVLKIGADLRAHGNERRVSAAGTKAPATAPPR